MANNIEWIGKEIRKSYAKRVPLPTMVEELLNESNDIEEIDIDYYYGADSYQREVNAEHERNTTFYSGLRIF